MLPFLKNRDDGVGVGPVETRERKPDEDPEYGMLDAVAEDLLEAVKKGDVELVKAALVSLCQHIQEQDAEQDQSMGAET